MTVSALFSGCAPAPSNESPASGSSRAARPPEQRSAAFAVKLKILDYKGVQRLIRSHRGKVVVMDVWSTSCLPCMREFHNLVEIHHKYPYGVACISLSLDYEGVGKPEDHRERVLKFLVKQGATFDNVLASEEPEAIYEKLDLASVPAVFVYDRDAALVTRFDNEDPAKGKFTYQQVKDLVARLLDKRTSNPN